MALRKPPQHRVDAPIVFVHQTDDAWDWDRVKSEQNKMRERGEDPLSHPVIRYAGGYTRYDLDAQATVLGEVVTVSSYLDDAKKPTKWKLRRLSWNDWYDVRPKWERAVRGGERPFEAYLQALRAGLVSVENGPTLTMPGGHIGHEDVARLFEINQELPFDLGLAVYQASLPLTVEEGKP